MFDGCRKLENPSQDQEARDEYGSTDPDPDLNPYQYVPDPQFTV
jgi:hypothetical protein